jgi:MFS-type transporter involved in bile tolerance (Atg22 family)
MVGLLSAVPFLPAVVLMLVVAHISDRTLARKRYIGPFLLLAGVALFISSLTAGHSFWLAYAFSVVAGGAMFAPYGPFFSIVPEMLPSNVAGEVMALVNSCGALGGFAGTWLVGLLQALTGNSRAGYLLMSILLMLAGGIIFRLRTAKPASNP